LEQPDHERHQRRYQSDTICAGKRNTGMKKFQMMTEVRDWLLSMLRDGQVKVK